MMNSRVEKDFEEFLFEGEELLTIEKALFTLLDKYKEQLIRGRLNMKEDTDKTINKCLEKLKQHENFMKNKKYFDIKVKKYDDYGQEKDSANNKVA